MEVSARYDAMTAAADQFVTAYSTLGDIELAVRRACELAASAAGDAEATAEMVRFCDRATAVMDDTCGRLLDVASGLRAALEAIWTAGGGTSEARSPESTRRPGGAR